MVLKGRPLLAEAGSSEEQGWGQAGGVLCWNEVATSDK